MTETWLAWERAYVGEPAERGEAGVVLLLDALSDRDATKPPGELVGVRCG